MSDVVLVKNVERVFYITINRPDKLNALSIEVWHELGKAFDEFEKSDARVCVLRGSGNKAFVAGADIDAYRTMSAKDFGDFIVEAGKIADRIFEIPKPFIAAIYGYALGGGLELALHCDLIVANKSAKLGLPEANLGLLPGGGGTQIVPRLIGVAKANDMIMRGRWLRGEEALNCGLISSVLDDEKFEEELAEYVSEVLKRAPLALGVLKNLVRQGLNLPFMDALKLEIEMTAPLIETADGREGVAAFIEKRAADFKGR
jgi:enoyl-CoA hydratase/carnithine racemase